MSLKVLAWPAFDPRTGNPYCSLLYRNLEDLSVKVHEFSYGHALFGKYDVLHLHWPERHLGSGTAKALAGIHVVFACVLWAKIRRAKVIWTAHNLVSHGRRHPLLERYFWFVFTRLINGFISLSKDGCEHARTLFSGLRNRQGFVVPHGHYRNAIPAEMSTEKARELLGISLECKVVLFFGRVSGYKNVPHLIRTFRQSRNEDWRLCVVGGLSSDVTMNDLTEATEGDSRVLLRIGWVSTEDIQMYFRSADLVVLPFREISNSGSVLLTMSFNTPLLTVAQGALPELQESIGREWISFYSNELELPHLISAMDWARHESRADHAPLAAFEWPFIARLTLNAYEAVVSNETQDRERPCVPVV
jgi:beta-1,4-mannosyltransferase